MALSARTAGRVSAVVTRAWSAQRYAAQSRREQNQRPTGAVLFQLAAVSRASQVAAAPS